MIIIVILVYLSIAIIELYPMLKSRDKGLYAYGILLAAAFTLSILLCTGIKVPSPAGAIGFMISSLLGWRQ